MLFSCATTLTCRSALINKPILRTQFGEPKTKGYSSFRNLSAILRTLSVIKDLAGYPASLAVCEYPQRRWASISLVMNSHLDSSIKREYCTRQQKPASFGRSTVALSRPLRITGKSNIQTGNKIRRWRLVGEVHPDIYDNVSHNKEPFIKHQFHFFKDFIFKQLF